MSTAIKSSTSGPSFLRSRRCRKTRFLIGRWAFPPAQVQRSSRFPGPPIFKISGTTTIAGTDIAAVYTPRINAPDISGLDWGLVDTTSTTLYLTHLYAYALPVKLGDAYHV